MIEDIGKCATDDISYLLARAANAGFCPFSGIRDFGVSANAIVRAVYGGSLPTPSELPLDRYDLAACELAVRRLPKHRQGQLADRLIAQAREAVCGRKP